MSARWPKRNQPLWGESGEERYQREKMAAEEKMQPTWSLVSPTWHQDAMNAMIYGSSATKLSWAEAEPKKEKKRRAPKGCRHKFQDYIGFTHAFQFCVHCDLKRDF